MMFQVTLWISLFLLAVNAFAATSFCDGENTDLSPLSKESICPSHHPALFDPGLDPEIRKDLESRIPPDEIIKCLEDVQLPYTNFDGQDVIGRMILNSDIALETKCMFKDFQDLTDSNGKRVGYKIASIKTADSATYLWQREALMEANITWGFNARELRNFRTMGRAFSLNPTCNPGVKHKAGGGFDFNTMEPKNSDPKKLFDNPSCFLGGFVGNSSGHPSTGIAAKVRALFRGTSTHYAKYEGWEWGGDWNDEKGFGRIQKRGLNHAVTNPELHPGPHRTKGPYCKVPSVTRKVTNREEVEFLQNENPTKDEYDKFCGKFKAKPKNQVPY